VSARRLLAGTLLVLALAFPAAPAAIVIGASPAPSAPPAATAEPGRAAEPAASAAPLPEGAVDLRSSGEGPGLRGGPLEVLAAVLLAGLASAGITAAWVRVGRRR